MPSYVDFISPQDKPAESHLLHFIFFIIVIIEFHFNLFLVFILFFLFFFCKSEIVSTQIFFFHILPKASP